MPLDLERDGVAVSEAVVGVDILQKLADEFEGAGVRIGARPFALSPAIKQLLEPGGLLTKLAAKWAGTYARPVRVLAFDKTPGGNWHLPWHQDRVIAVKNSYRSSEFRHLDDQERTASCGSAGEPARKDV